MSIKRILTFPGQGQIIAQDYLLRLQTTAFNIEPLKESLSKQLTMNFTNRLFQESPKYSPSNFLGKTSNLQPAVIGITSHLTTLMKQHDVDLKPDYVMGHSLGELSALLYNELFDLDYALYLARKRGKFMEQCVGDRRSEKKRKKNLIKFGMTALIIPRTIENGVKFIETELEKLEEELKQWVYIANHNSANQVVISGRSPELEVFSSHLKSLKIKGIPLKTKIAFHTPILQDAEERFRRVLEGTLLQYDQKDQELKVPIISNLTGKVTTSTSEALENFIKCFTQPVLFQESITNLVEQEKDFKFEVFNLGPNAGVNQGLIKANMPSDGLVINDIIETVEDIEKLKA